MPIFEYVCVTCGKQFEKLQKPVDAGQTECPMCGSVDVKKELSSFASVGAASSAQCNSGG